MAELPYKIEAIIIRDTERDNLHISWDEEDGFVFLFTPDMNNTDNHYHIELSNEQAVQLEMFLTKKLEEQQQDRVSWESAVEILKKAPNVEPEPHDQLG